MCNSIGKYSLIMTNKHITIATLRDSFDAILEKLKSDNITEIQLDTDLYRLIPTDSWNNFDKNEIVVGSLYDDLDSLSKALKDDNRPFTYVDFDRTAMLLRYISEKLNPVNY
jgi:hypothetical protein